MSDSQRQSSASKAVDEVVGKLDQVFKLRTDRFNSLDSVIAQLREKNKNITDKYHKSQSEIREVNLKMGQLKEAFEKEKRLINSQFSHDVQEAKLKLEEKQTQYNLLDKKHNDLLDEATHTKDKLSRVEAQLQDALDSKAQLQEVVENLNLSVEERIKRAAGEAERTIHNLSAKHEAEQRRLKSALRSQEMRVEDIREEAEREINEYTKKLDLERRRTDELAREKDSLRSEITRLNSIVTSIQSTVDHLLAEEMRMSGSYETSIDRALDDDYDDLSARSIFEKPQRAKKPLGYIDLGDSIKRAALEDRIK